MQQSVLTQQFTVMAKLGWLRAGFCRPPVDVFGMGNQLIHRLVLAQPFGRRLRPLWPRPHMTTASPVSIRKSMICVAHPKLANDPSNPAFRAHGINELPCSLTSWQVFVAVEITFAHPVAWRDRPGAICHRPPPSTDSTGQPMAETARVWRNLRRSSQA